MTLAIKPRHRFRIENPQENLVNRFEQIMSLSHGNEAILRYGLDALTKVESIVLNQTLRLEADTFFLPRGYHRKIRGNPLDFLRTRILRYWVNNISSCISIIVAKINREIDQENLFKIM